MNLFVITSPLQYINAIEALSFFSIKSTEAILVIKLSHDINSNQQLQELINKKDWYKIIINKKEKGFWNFIKDLALLKNLNTNYISFKRVFIGDFLQWNSRMFIINIKAKEYLLLDDGLSTIHIYENCLKKIEDFRDNRKDVKIKSLIAKILYKLKTNISDKKNINLFTSFKLLAYPNIKIYENNYFVLKSRQNSTLKKMNFSTIIIGSPFVDKNMLSQDTYLNYLSQIQKSYQNTKIKYIPHRAESKNLLNQIKQLDNIDLYTINNSVELEFLDINLTGVTVAGFYSTALVNLNKMYNLNKIDSFIIDFSHLDETIQNRISEAYHYLGQISNIQLKKLKN